MRYDPYGTKFPRMTRQQFELIAYVVGMHIAYEHCESPERLIERFVAELVETNRNFDAAKFTARCLEEFRK